MKSLAEKFRQLLAEKTQEEFDKEWAEIEALGLEGPLAKDFIRSFRYTPAVRENRTSGLFTAQNAETLLAHNPETSNYQFAMAA